MAIFLGTGRRKSDVERDHVPEKWGEAIPASDNPDRAAIDG